jgi:transglutaminase-like putative cysteine protease
MRIRYGFNIEITVPQRTTVITKMDLVPERRGDVVWESPLAVSPPATMELWTDSFGNRCRRIQAEQGSLSLALEGVIADHGAPDPVDPSAELIAPSDLPVDTLQFLAGSRYCETEFLNGFAWQTFGHLANGWERVQAVCDFVHNHLTFSYPLARETRTALEAFNERLGVCRDFTHLAITLCRCLNIPARYCNGYLGDIGIPANPAPMDFNAWFEAYIGNRWYVFDARHNTPRIGRITLARGRDAMDIPMIQTFGPHMLGRFEVITEEVDVSDFALAAE